MLGHEDVVIAELVGELDLLQRFVIYLQFVLLVPLVGIERFGRLQLEVNAEFHALLSLLKARVSTRAQVAWGRMCATYTCNRIGCQPEEKMSDCSVSAFLSGLWHNSVGMSSTLQCRLMSTRKRR